ncbi:MAG: SDR family NAD(P)-dependent oxidoreductase [Gemmatimonadaceae bacterium]
MSNNADVIVITGASGGIGAAIARRLGRDGKRLVLAARREDKLRTVASDAESLGASQVLVVPTDVTRRIDVMHLRDEAIKAFGQIDVWINNAGRGITKPVLDLTDADLDDMIAINLTSALYGMQAAIPLFIERGKGHLINVSTFLARVPLAPYRSAYSAAKAALNSLTANLRMDVHAKYPNIQVSLVMPGVVATDFADNAKTPEAIRPDRPGRTAAGAVQTADEVAETIAELISHPVPEIYTNPASSELARVYYADVGGFEERVASHRR